MEYGAESVPSSSGCVVSCEYQQQALHMCSRDEAPRDIVVCRRTGLPNTSSSPASPEVLDFHKEMHGKFRMGFQQPWMSNNP